MKTQQRIKFTPDVKSIDKIDEVFYSIFKDLSDDAINNVRLSTDQIFSLSKNYLNKDLTVLLKRFHSLYFGENNKDQQTEINKQVDDIFDQVSEQVDSGNLQDIKIVESEEDNKKRLYLSAIQKKVEGIITLDSGIREKVMPSIHSMQFEDAVRQRLSHLNDTWEFMKDVENDDSLQKLKEKITNLCSSQEETNDFYSIVLGEEPPETTTQSELFF